MWRVVVLAPVVLTWACSRHEPIASCDDDLRGVYTTGPEPLERWMVLDHGPTLEAYAVFPDGEVAGGVVAAPRVIDLIRAPLDTRAPGEILRGPPGATEVGPPAAAARGSDGLAGTLHRRFMQRQDSCEGHVPVHVTRCSGDTLELVVADPPPPLAFAPCAWGRSGSSRLVRWRRE